MVPNKRSPELEKQESAALNRAVDDFLALNVTLHQHDWNNPACEIAALLVGLIHALAEHDPKLIEWVKVALWMAEKEKAKKVS
jgi:hypothetical protein